MKLIAFAIFCLVTTETITGTSVTGSLKQPDSVAVNNATVTKSDIDLKKPDPEPPKDNTTTTSTTPATTLPTTPTTTASPPTTQNTTTQSPPKSTTPSTNVTTTTAPITTIAPTDSPAHKTDRKFDSFSFIAGIVMAAGLMAIGLVAFKFYEARRDRNYHTI